MLYTILPAEAASGAWARAARTRSRAAPQPVPGSSQAAGSKGLPKGR